MPFKKKHSRNMFLGRTQEMQLFVEDILTPDEPIHNILSISGQGGVGKTTLLMQFREKASTPPFDDYCLTAWVDEHSPGPVNMMEEFARQLGIGGRFEKEMRLYKESLRKLQSEQESSRNMLTHKIATNLVEGAVKGVPIVGGILEKEAEPMVEYILNEFHYRQQLKYEERLEDPLRDITDAFVEELNALTDTFVAVGHHRAKRLQRVLLFFDTFEHMSVETPPWLLNYFLRAYINPDVVLVIAGRDPIERTMPDDPKQWLVYRDDGSLCQLPIRSFTEEETHAYLVEQGITAPDRINKIWQLSQGLTFRLIKTKGLPALRREA